MVYLFLHTSLRFLKVSTSKSLPHEVTRIYPGILTTDTMKIKMIRTEIYTVIYIDVVLS